MGRPHHSDVGGLAAGFAEIRNSYEAARDSRFRRAIQGVNWSGSGADFHFRSEMDHLRLLEYARNFDRNDPVIGQAVTRLTENVLQDGPGLMPKTPDDDLNAYIGEELWGPWSSDPEQCHKAGELTVHRMASLMLRNMVVDGDMMALFLRGGKVELVEAHRLRSPNRSKRKHLVLGVLQDSHRKRLEYWFTKEDISPLTPVKVGEMTQIRVRDKDGNRQLVHLMDPRRASQTRGVTFFAPIAAYMGMFDDLQFAHLVAAQTAACITFFREREIDYEGPKEPPANGPEETETQSDGSTRVIANWSPGTEITGAPGEKLSGFSPDVPNSEFFEQAKLVLTIMSVNLGLPLSVVLLDASNSNFSGQRAEMNQARSGFKRLHALVVETFYSELYRWRLRAWSKRDPEVKKGLKAFGDGLFRHEFAEPFWSYIEPSKDATADKIIVQTGLNSLTRVLARRGLDIKTVQDEQIAERRRFIELSIEAAGAVNKDHPDAQVDWREIAQVDAKGRKPLENPRAVEQMQSAVRSGVRVGEAEMRIAMGLVESLPEGDMAVRFNDKDLLEYHAKHNIAMRSDFRGSMGLEVVPERDDVFVGGGGEGEGGELVGAGVEGGEGEGGGEGDGGGEGEGEGEGKG